MKKKVGFFIYNMGSGGAERIAAFVVNHWAKEHDVVLFTFAEPGAGSHYQVDPAVRRVDLDCSGNSGGLKSAVAENAKRVRKVRKAIIEENLDIAVSLMDTMNITVLLATIGLDVPVIASDRIHPHHGGEASTGPWSVLRQLTYHRAKMVIVETQETAQVYPSRVRTRVIPNAAPAILDGDEKQGKRFSAAGRFVHQKGFDVLLEAFAIASQSVPDWSLTIWGDGELRPKLTAQAERLGITDKVNMPGVIPKLPQALAGTEIFVLSSRFEGWGLVLTEAMAAGCAVVSTACPSGPRDIVRDGVDGILVPIEDAQALADAMVKVASDENLRLELAKRATEITERFSAQRVLSAWDDALMAAV